MDLLIPFIQAQRHIRCCVCRHYDNDGKMCLIVNLIKIKEINAVDDKYI